MPPDRYGCTNSLSCRSCTDGLQLHICTEQHDQEISSHLQPTTTTSNQYTDERLNIIACMCSTKNKYLRYGRDRMKLDSFRLSPVLFAKSCTKLHFWATPWWHQVSTLSKSFNAKKLCSRVSSTECQFYS